SSTKLTAPDSTSSANRTSPTTTSLNGSTVKLNGDSTVVATSGSFRRNCSTASCTFDFAALNVIPDFKRAAPWRMYARLLLFGSICNGSQISAGGSDEKLGVRIP